MRITHRIIDAVNGKRLVLVVGLTCLIIQPVNAMSQSQDGADKSPQTKPEMKREWFNQSSENRGDTTSAALLKKLQETRPFNAIISSKRSRELQAKGKPKPLLPEGTRVVERVGSILHEGQWWYFQPSGDNSGDAMRLLPSEWLEVMIRSGMGTTEPILFSLSGEITEFSGSNYVLAHAVSRIQAMPKLSDTNQAESEIAPDASIDDVVARLRDINPQAQLLTPADSTFPPMPKFVAPALPSVRPEGTPMIRRPGRLIEESPWWTFVLESNSHNEGQLPIKLLPNRNVELMIDNISRGAEGVVFLVSGQLTLYNGENYLHVQAVTRQVDIGNLRK